MAITDRSAMQLPSQVSPGRFLTLRTTLILMAQRASSEVLGLDFPQLALEALRL